MLSLEQFTICINKLASLENLEFSDNWMVSMYEELSPYFDDENFGMACREILHHEDLYGKMPTLSVFMKYSINKPKSILQIQNEAKQKFLNKIGSYLSEYHHYDFEREAFNNNLTEIEHLALQSLGGLPSIWESCHREDYPRSISSIQKDLGSFFDCNYTIERADIKAISSRISEVTSIGSIAKKFLTGSKDVLASNDDKLTKKGA